ncbi:MAG: aspartate/tyrosine/aromatic aminotransferase [Candidatus Hydrogenedentes bacterium]|nr:aspartate/tyrosine/aromatic aminotransferase [Candidatus Hydrogenedentota bacterium]
MFFDSVEAAPPDSILGLTEAFRDDPNPDKINLSVGVYQDATGTTPVFTAVKKAEERLLADETTKSYLAIEGTREYGRAVRELLFGAEHEIVASGRAVTAHTPGGTGALRVAAEFIRRIRPGATVWLSDPTWPNHPAIFGAAGLATKRYTYYDHETKSLDFDGLCAALGEVQAGDVIVLHGCCHNPSGMDPDLEQWRTLAERVHEKGALPFFDFAYQGLGDGLDEDAAGLRTFCTLGQELLVASSYSKNFGLYRERCGALTLVAPGADEAATCLTQIKSTIRANYSNPPAHGAAIVSTILNDDALREDWNRELTTMRERIRDIRARFVDELKALGVERDFSFLTRQKGMFSFSGLTKEQVQILREKNSIYIVGSGRINVAGLTESNIRTVCKAVAAVL